MFAEAQTIEIESEDELTGTDIWSLAACNDGSGTMIELFFSEDLLDIARAKHVCSRCPVRRTCLAQALERREPWGVWGGELFANGRVLAHKRRRGRPPKHRPAEIVVIDGVEVVVAPAICAPAAAEA